MRIYEQAAGGDPCTALLGDGAVCPQSVDVVDAHGNITVLFIRTADSIATIYYYDPSRFFSTDRRFVVGPGSRPPEGFVDAMEDASAMPVGSRHADVLGAVILRLIRGLLRERNLFVEFEHHVDYGGIRNPAGGQWSHVDSISLNTGTHGQMRFALAGYFKEHMTRGGGFRTFLDEAKSNVDAPHKNTHPSTANVCFMSAALAALYAPTGNAAVRSVLSPDIVDSRQAAEKGLPGLLRVAAEARMKGAMDTVAMAQFGSPSSWNVIVAIIRGLIGKTLRGTDAESDLSIGQQDPSDVLMRIYELYGASADVVSSPDRSFITAPGYEIAYRVASPDREHHFIHVELQRGIHRTREQVFEKIRHEGALYELTGVIQHMGGISYGHYITYVNLDGVWHVHNNLSDPLTRPVTSKAAMLADIGVNGKVFMYMNKS